MGERNLGHFEYDSITAGSVPDSVCFVCNWQNRALEGRRVTKVIVDSPEAMELTECEDLEDIR